MKIKTKKLKSTILINLPKIEIKNITINKQYIAGPKTKMFHSGTIYRFDIYFNGIRIKTDDHIRLYLSSTLAEVKEAIGIAITNRIKGFLSAPIGIFF